MLSAAIRTLLSDAISSHNRVPRPAVQAGGASFRRSARTGWPFTMTCRTPTAYWCGFSKVAGSMICSGSKMVMSATNPGLQNPAIVKSKRRRRQRGHLAHRIFQPDGSASAHIAPQYAGIGAVAAGMRHAAAELAHAAVGGDRDERVLQDVLDLTLVHRVEHAAGAAVASMISITAWYCSSIVTSGSAGGDGRQEARRCALLLPQLGGLRDLLDVPPGDLRMFFAAGDDGVSQVGASAADLVVLLHVAINALTCSGSFSNSLA